MKRPRVLLTSLLLIVPSAPAQRPREHFDHAEVVYDWVTNSRGDRLRTFTTRPKAVGGKAPAIFFVGWLSCDSVEYAAGETDGFGAFLRRTIEQSGFATVRMDKPGVGESQGTPCEKADFQGEMEGYQAAFDSMLRRDFIDPGRIVVIGLSNGGGVAPLVARNHRVRGFVALGSWGRTWYEHMLELERRRLTGERKSPSEVNQAMKIFARFYDLFLVQRMTPGEILRQHPDWRSFWYDAPDGQYGRPASFYQQLQDLNLGAVWSTVNAPVLVIRGTADEVMSHADSSAIADTVNQVHPGRARFLEVDRMTHGFTIHQKFHAELVSIVMKWMNDCAMATRQGCASSPQPGQACTTCLPERSVDARPQMSTSPASDNRLSRSESLQFQFPRRSLGRR